MSKSTGIVPHTLDFTFDAGTSRGVLRQKPAWYLLLRDEQGREGIGEAGPLKGLSVDDQPNFEGHLRKMARRWEQMDWPQSPADVATFVKNQVPDAWPSIRFGLETALLDLLHGGERIIFPGDLPFGESQIPINGLIWMGDREFMFQQIGDKLDAGFTCLKMKIGAIDFATELDLLGYIRQQFGPDKLILRVDANGAFAPHEAMDKLKQLAAFDLHSIEQPIMAGQVEAMQQLCQVSPVPIALDEELIGVAAFAERRRLLESIRPPYIILKPSLVGGFADCDEWISLCEELEIDWWMTSALESNIGLNAISQYTAHKQAKGHQGLGTGQLYSNNIPSPMVIDRGHLCYEQSQVWDLSLIKA